jgi:hypothetical protein
MNNERIIMSKMPRPPETTKRHRLVFRMNPDDPDSQVSFRTTRRDELDDIYEEYGFPSRSAFLRCMVELGIQNLTKDYLQEEDDTQAVGESEAKTIREMVPEGEENAVDVRNELPEMIENELLDIVDQDPEIKRSGWEVYR